MTQREREELERRAEQIRRELRLPILPTGRELALVEQANEKKRRHPFYCRPNDPSHVGRKSTA
jgi:hypothetical protein